MEYIVAIIGSSATAALISGVFNLLSRRKQKASGLEAGVRILLYDRIKHLGTSYCDDGKISYDAMEDLIKMHSVYHTDLHGNGFLDELMARVKQLPRV